jgi:hypothetical protein
MAGLSSLTYRAMVQQRLVYCNPNGLADPFTCFST